MERRIRRSEHRAEAATLFLESLRAQERLGALALSSGDGLYIAGSGEGDLEELGAWGAAGADEAARQGVGVLFVQRFDVDGYPMVLTSRGAPVRGLGPVESLRRILS